METFRDGMAIFMAAIIAIVSIMSVNSCATEDLRDQNRRTFVVECSKAGFTAEECLQLWASGREVETDTDGALK